MKNNDNINKIKNKTSHAPVITCAGDWNLFCTLEAPLIAAIPQDSCEWRRSHGRIPKSVFIEATFEKFTKELLPSENERNLLNFPIFHIYWTDCADIETYKTSSKEQIEAWFKILNQHNITDWMIVLVETYDIRKTNKLLPRTTVLDKIRNDFAAKNGDRCVSVINPIKSESRSAESWRSLVARIRQLVLISYNKTLISFEKYMREQREKRNKPNWDFVQYFFLQEQLAFVFEMLGLYDEALLQYDELDALFTQFVLNSNATGIPDWLSGFLKPVESWQGVCLNPSSSLKRRELIVSQTATLIDFRSYLFQRQSAMLLAASKPWEIASRCVSVVHNTIREARLLEVKLPDGAFACWALLTCLEVLQTCEKLAVNASHQVVQQCAVHQAPLWHYAKDKLCELGKMCGLMPGTPDPSSAQLHLVVMLSAGMGDSEVSNTQNSLSIPTPIDKFKEALGSKQAFQTQYFELAELAMGTYKHIGRLRCAQLIGRDLAAFYNGLGETVKACVFLLDALRSYEDQGWKDLAAQTRLELIACYLKMEDFEKYTKLSATISCTLELEILVRNFYFDEMLKSIKNKLQNREKPIVAELNECFKVIAVEILPSERENYITDNPLKVCLSVESFFPRELVCQRASISIEDFKESEPVEDKLEKSSDRSNKTDNLNSSNVVSSPIRKSAINNSIVNTKKLPNLAPSYRLQDVKSANPFLNPLNISLKLHWKEDKTLDSAFVHYDKQKSKMKRRDSGPEFGKQSVTTKKDFAHSVVYENFSIKPGINSFVLETIIPKAGVFKLGQISLVIQEKLEYLSNVLLPFNVGFEAISKGVYVALNKENPKKDLVAGVEHHMELVINSNSTPITENSTINIDTTSGLSLKLRNSGKDEFSNQLKVSVPPCKPFETVTVPLTMISALSPKKNDKPVEHTVQLHCPWFENPVIVNLHFDPPFSASFKLFTSNTRKLIHVRLTPSNFDHIYFSVFNPILESESKVTLVALNPKTIKEYQLGSSGTSATYMWEVQMDPLEKPLPVKTMFNIKYRVLDEAEDSVRQYKCPFEMINYSTLFLVKLKIEPTKGSEFCRASQMCYLQLTVQKINETDSNSLMYEVLADKTMWAVCGRTAGVITLENSDPQSITLDVMPLIAGFLPLPNVRLSKYIAATAQAVSKDGKKVDSSSGASHPRLEPFNPGQVYHSGKAQQVHVCANLSSTEAH